MKKCIVVVLILLHICLFGIAIEDVSLAIAGEWHSPLKLRQVSQDGARHRVYIVVDKTVLNPASCSTVNYYEVTSDHDPDRALAILLSAFLTDSSISVYVDSNHCGVYGNPVVTTITIKK